jgi:hypothetical protein
MSLTITLIVTSTTFLYREGIAGPRKVTGRSMIGSRGHVTQQRQVEL